MVHGKNRIPYWIDRRLSGLAGPEYHAIISIGLPIEPEDSQYGESWIEPLWGDREVATMGFAEQMPDLMEAAVEGIPIVIVWELEKSG